MSQGEDEIMKGRENRHGLPITEVRDWEFRVVPIFEVAQFIANVFYIPISTEKANIKSMTNWDLVCWSLETEQENP